MMPPRPATYCWELLATRQFRQAAIHRRRCPTVAMKHIKETPPRCPPMPPGGPGTPSRLPCPRTPAYATATAQRSPTPSGPLWAKRRPPRPNHAGHRPRAAPAAIPSTGTARLVAEARPAAPARPCSQTGTHWPPPAQHRSPLVSAAAVGRWRPRRAFSRSSSRC